MCGSCASGFANSDVQVPRTHKPAENQRSADPVKDADKEFAKPDVQPEERRPGQGCRHRIRKPRRPALVNERLRARVQN